MELRHIVVEGPIAVGKTSLCRIIADEFGGELELDPTRGNPFLDGFYKEPERWALAAQLEFLLRRLDRRNRIAERVALGKTVVSDYLVAKEDIFARLTLGEAELGLYRELARRLAQSPEAAPPRPDLVVYLEARYEVLRERLVKRNRDFEQRISSDYLKTLAEAYRQYFHSYDEAPLLVVNCSSIDFLDSADERVDLLREIRSAGRGVQHYIPLGSR
jgi:deoxyguanosine kinase